MGPVRIVIGLLVTFPLAALKLFNRSHHLFTRIINQGRAIRIDAYRLNVIKQAQQLFEMTARLFI